MYHMHPSYVRQTLGFGVFDPVEFGWFPIVKNDLADATHRQSHRIIGVLAVVRTS